VKHLSRFRYQFLSNDPCRICGGEIKVLVDNETSIIEQVIRCEYCGHIQTNLLKRKLSPTGDLDEGFLLRADAALFGDDFSAKNIVDNLAR